MLAWPKFWVARQSPPPRECVAKEWRSAGAHRLGEPRALRVLFHMNQKRHPRQRAAAIAEKTKLAAGARFTSERPGEGNPRVHRELVRPPHDALIGGLCRKKGRKHLQIELRRMSAGQAPNPAAARIKQFQGCARCRKRRRISDRGRGEEPADFPPA